MVMATCNQPCMIKSIFTSPISTVTYCPVDAHAWPDVCLRVLIPKHDENNVTLVKQYRTHLIISLVFSSQG